MSLELELNRLKADFNYSLNRYKKAVKVFETYPIEKSLKFINAFNEVVRDISNSMNKLEILMNRKLTAEELENGFKEVKK